MDSMSGYEHTAVPMAGSNNRSFPDVGMYFGYAGQNHSVVDVDEYLWRLNQDKVIVYLPVILYVFLCVIVGIIGNSCVCYIYTHRLRRSPSRIFILFLAILDLVSCIVGAGSELVDLFQPYVFTATWYCKIMRFGLSFTIISASFTLICVAFDRYYKVCKPLNAFPIRKVKTLCIVVATLSFVLSSPAIALFGLKTVQTDVPEIVGHECSTADYMKGTPLPIAYYVILFTAFLVLLACFVLLYVRIGIEIWKRKRLTIGETLPDIFVQKMKSGDKQTQQPVYKRSESVQPEDVSGPSCQTDEDSPTYSESRAGCDNIIVADSACSVGASGKNDLNTTVENNVSDGKRRKPLLKRRRSNLGRMSIRTLRTTSIFFAVSAAFVISFLPYLIANVLKFTKICFHDPKTSSEEVAYNFCVRSYFISNFINPIIYSALNINFRRECKKLFKRLILKFKSVCLCQQQ